MTEVQTCALPIYTTHRVVVVSVVTALVTILIVIFDLKSAADVVHARIPYIYLGYIAAGIGWYWVRRNKGLGNKD